MACVYAVQSKSPYRSTRHRKLSVARKVAKARGGRIVKMCGKAGSRTITNVSGVRKRKRRRSR